MKKVKKGVRIGDTVKWKSLRWGHVFQGKVLAKRIRNFGGSQNEYSRKIGVQIAVTSKRYHDMFKRKVTWIALKSLI